MLSIGLSFIVMATISIQNNSIIIGKEFIVSFSIAGLIFTITVILAHSIKAIRDDSRSPIIKIIKYTYIGLNCIAVLFLMVVPHLIKLMNVSEIKILFVSDITLLFSIGGVVMLMGIRSFIEEKVVHVIAKFA